MMRSNQIRTRSLLFVAVAIAVAAIAGCGSPTPQRDAPPGTTLEVNGVSYEVQISRQLNPYDDGDRALFQGVPAAGRRLPGDQVWLGVFMQAENDSHDRRRAARSVSLADDFDHVFRPVRLPGVNDYAYRPVLLAPGETEPTPDSPAASAPEQGSLLLFHLPMSYCMSNRPLELRIRDHGTLASVQLDV
jgi:hypothetical protein